MDPQAGTFMSGEPARERECSCTSAYYAIHYSLGSTGIAVVSLGMGIMTCIKAAGLVIFAFAISGLLGVGFGELWTGILETRSHRDYL